MEAAHVLVVGDSAWICTGTRGEHNRKVRSSIKVYNHGVRFVPVDLPPGTVVSIETGARLGHPSREVIHFDRQIGVLVGSDDPARC